VRELLPVVSSYLQQYANLEVELDSMIAHVSLEHVTQSVSLSHCPVIFVCSISFFSNRATILKVKSYEVCCYISVRTVVHYHSVPIMFDISLASY